jgi:hypothetical protein
MAISNGNIPFNNFSSGGILSSHIIPGAYSHIVANVGSAGVVQGNVGVIMGQCTQGQPQVLMQFNSPTQAEQTLGSGELCDAVRMAFNPSPNYTPQAIYAMRVNSATQSTLNLSNAIPNVVIALTSADYGLITQQVNITISAGTNVGQKLVINFQNNTQTFDNTYRSSLTLTHATATVSITTNSGTNTMVLSVGTYTIQLANYPTLAALAAYINTLTGYTAVVTAGQSNASPLLLDSTASAQSLLGGYVCTSNMQAVIDTINNNCIYATAVAANGANNRTAPSNIATTYFGTGTDGTYTATDWTNALTAMTAYNVNFIATPNSSASVWASISAHVTSMCAPSGRKERQFLCGNAYGTTDTQRVTDAQTLNSQYGMYVVQGFTQYNINGIATQYGAGYTACLLLGIICSTAINMPLTSKTLNVISLEANLPTSRVEPLLSNGCCVVNYDASGLPKIVRQLNSYQTANLLWNEWSSVREMNYVSLDLRNYLQNLYVGQPGSNFSQGVIIGAVTARLKYYVSQGIFTADNTGKSFWNIQISLNGSVLTIDYDAYITLPINFVFLTQHFHDVVQAVS